MEPLSYDEFKETIRASKRAWHLEQKDTYNVQSEDEPFRRFLDSEPDDYAWLAEWLGFVQEVTCAGVIVERLRVATVPHSDYTQWGFAVAPHNIRAGEDLRYVPRHLVGNIVFPDEGCWLMDDDTLVLSVFSNDGRVGGFTRSVDRELITEYRAIRDQLWPRAIPYAQYVTTA